MNLFMTRRLSQGHRAVHQRNRMAIYSPVKVTRFVWYVLYTYNIYAFSSLTKCINHLNRQNRQKRSFFFVSPDKTRLVLLTTSLCWAALCSFFAIINVTNVLAFQSKILKKTICTKRWASLYLEMASF